MILRSLATLALLTSCSRQIPAEETFPAQPTLVEGPPGGAMDPEWQTEGYANDTGAMDNVTDAEIDVTLDAYGEWIQLDGYGSVWRPYTTVVGVDFTPYETCGSWVWTDWGWTFACEWDWGWLPFHYGRWGWFDDYWGWLPDDEWSPACVEWRGGGGYIGWRPLVPARDHRRRPHYNRTGAAYARDHRTGVSTARGLKSQWRFMAETEFGKPRIRAHLFKEPLEGLHVTAPMTRPPIVGSVQAVKVASLMKGRFGASIREARNGRPPTAEGRSRTDDGPSRADDMPSRADDVHSRPARQPTFDAPSRQPHSPPRFDRPSRAPQPPPAYSPARQPSDYSPRPSPSFSPSSSRSSSSSPPARPSGGPSIGGGRRR